MRLFTTSGECLCTLLPDSAVTVMTKVLYAPSTQHLVGLLAPTGDVFAYSTTRGAVALLEWKVGEKVRLNHDKVNDIALCVLTLQQVMFSNFTIFTDCTDCTDCTTCTTCTHITHFTHL